MNTLFSWIKKNLTLTNLLIVGLAVLLLLQRCDNQKQFKRLENNVNSQEQILSEKLNDFGEKVTTISVNAFKASELKILKDMDAKYGALETRLQANGRRIKDLQSSVAFTINAKGEGVAQVDTVYRNKIIDNYFPNIPGWRYSDGVVSISSTLRADSSLLQSYKLGNLRFTADVFAKNRFLRKPLFYADITSLNPGISISDNKAFVKKHPKAFLTFAVGVGGTLTPDLQLKPGIQLGIYKPIYTIYK